MHKRFSRVYVCTVVRKRKTTRNLHPYSPKDVPLPTAPIGVIQVGVHSGAHQALLPVYNTLSASHRRHTSGRGGLSASSRPSRRAAGTSTGAAGPAAGGCGLGPRPSRSVLHVSPAWRQCALHVGVVCRPRLVRHDVRLVPRPGPPGLRPGGPGSARGPAGQCCMSALHGGSAPCMWECFVDLVSSVTTCGWYLDRGRRACGRGVRARPAAQQVSAACLPCMVAVFFAFGCVPFASCHPS